METLLSGTYKGPMMKFDSPKGALEAVLSQPTFDLPDVLKNAAKRPAAQADDQADGPADSRTASSTQSADLDVSQNAISQDGVEKHRVEDFSHNALNYDQVGICFGMDAAMALNDRFASKDVIEAANERGHERARAMKRAHEIQLARASAPFTWTDERGTVWTYVILDKVSIRIAGCEPASGTAELTIPDEIDGKPVVGISADAFTRLDGITSITCPDSIQDIESCSFRNNRTLKRVVYPSELAEYNPEWTRDCPNLEEVVYPGLAPKIVPGLFDAPKLKRLVIGSGTSEVEPSAFAKSQLESISVSETNPYLVTDGVSIYSRQDGTLLALAIPVTGYDVHPACRHLGEKAFSGCRGLAKLTLPDTLETIAPFALAWTGIQEFTAPTALRSLGEKALFGCRKLVSVTLNDGLESIGQNAFAQTAITKLHIPASVREFTAPLTESAPLSYVAPESGFSIAEDSPYFQVDEFGGIYAKMPDGSLEFACLLNTALSFYRVIPGAVAIRKSALAKHPSLMELELPEGLTVIREKACKACLKLARVNFPESLTRVEDEAFLDTALTSLHIPANLTFLGYNALIVKGAHNGIKAPSLQRITVDAANPRFYTVPGLLMERWGNGMSRVTVFTGNCECVRIPEEAAAIAPYALNNAAGIRELHLHDGLTVVGVCALGIGSTPDLVRITTKEPVQGRSVFDFNFPKSDRGSHQVQQTLGNLDKIDVEALFYSYDCAISNNAGFDPKAGGGMPLYEQGLRIIARLQDPIFLTRSNRALLEGIITDHLGDLCVEIAKHDDRPSIDALLDLGFLTKDNLFEIIDRVSAVQDAAMTGYLLEVKRRCFQEDMFSLDDFDL